MTYWLLLFGLYLAQDDALVGQLKTKRLRFAGGSHVAALEAAARSSDPDEAAAAGRALGWARAALSPDKIAVKVASNVRDDGRVELTLELRNTSDDGLQIADPDFWDPSPQEKGMWEESGF
jgi:hypothetical protein